MAECAHCGKDGMLTPIADQVDQGDYQKTEVSLCEGCEALYRAKDIQFMQWFVAHRGTPAR